MFVCKVSEVEYFQETHEGESGQRDPSLIREIFIRKILIRKILVRKILVRDIRVGHKRDKSRRRDASPNETL